MNLGWIIALIAGILIIKFAAGILFKLLGALCILAGLVLVLYQNEIWPFREASVSIEWLNKKYCNTETPDKPKCNCIVKKIEADMNTRFTEIELEELSQNRIQAAYVLKRSFEKQRNDIRNCLGSDADKELGEFNDALWHQDHETLQKTGNWLNEKSDRLKESLNELKNVKSAIDSKYDE